MFDFDNKEWIMKIVNMRDEDQIIIPLYVQIYGKKYSLLELDQIKVRFVEGAFKVGYGTADALFMPNSFPVNRVRDFDIINVFTEYDNVKDRTIRYMTFESGDVDVKEDNKLDEQIHMYFEALFNRVKEIVNSYFKSLIAQDEHPIIPKEEVIPQHIPVVDEDTEDDDIPYPSADDEYDEYYFDKEESPFEDDPEEVDEEDPLEELRKEVAEYSQDDEDNKLLIVETDKTGKEIVSATKVTLDLPKEEGYPRVTEEGLIGKETVDFINGEGKYSDDNEDYSTDFDIF